MSAGKVYDRHAVSIDCGSPHSGHFGARLDLCGTGVENHVLLLTMRLYLKQVTTIDNWVSVPAGVDVERFKWSVAEWSEYQRKLKACGAFWHRRFCLVPPPDAGEFKYSGGFFQGSYMPNIECHFELEFCGANERHWEVRVLKAADGAREETATGIGSAELDSTDADSVPRTVRDGSVILQTAAAHEIGHMLGQPHAGALLKSNDCMRAIKLAMTQAGANAPVASYLLNSHNASACYGLVDGKLVPGVAENVMGLGMAVTEVNAISWQNTVATLVWGTPSLPSGWKTVMRSYVGPTRLG